MKKALVAGVLLALTACAPLPPTGPAPERPVRSDISRFSLDGHFSLILGRDAQSGRLAWSHEPGEEHVLVISPLGQTLARLSATSEGAKLETADGHDYTADSLDALAPQVFGQPLPLSDLPGWLLGQAGPRGLIARDALGRATSIEQGGWRVDYLEYEGESPNALPRLLKISRGEMSLKLRLDLWSLRP